MLSLSNELAYHGLMVPGARQDPPDPHDVFSLPASAETRVVESFWADSPATTAGTHVQPDEVVRARKVLDYLGARGVPMTQVMALSPFQEVAEVLADLGRDYPGLGGGTTTAPQPSFLPPRQPEEKPPDRANILHFDILAHISSIEATISSLVRFLNTAVVTSAPALVKAFAVS